ncbi:MAG: VWA-like domain-containing protein [Pseudomonadota bacterium]
MEQELKTKISAARTQLILDKPFLGALVLRLPVVEADPSWCKTTATDMKKLYINAEYFRELKKEEAQFALAHEALHCALSHFSRRMFRIKQRWDLACDYAINPILVREGLKPPPDVMLMWPYEGMTAEEIYPLLQDNELQDNENNAKNELGQDDSQGDSEQGEQSDQGDKKNTQNQKLNSSQQESLSQQKAGEDGKGQTGEGKETESDSGGHDDIQKHPPEKLNNDEVQTLTAQWQQRMAGAAQQALQAGKLSQAMIRLVDHLLQPQLPWRMLLARYVSATAREDYSYSRPSSRRGDPAIYPRLRSHKVDVIAVIDISGSIATSELKEFLSEINQIKAQIRAKVTLLACDAKIDPDGPWEYEPWEEFDLPKSFSGGGGTDFKPIFDWVENNEINPDLLVYFTDAEGGFPEIEPPYPVIWLVKGKEKVPWGQRIQLN